MKFHKNFVLGILALELTTCMCQFGGELMGGDMLGLLGGLAFMSGQNWMNGLGGMSGPGGMSSFSGIGGLGGIGRQVGTGRPSGMGHLDGIAGPSGMNSLGGMDRRGGMGGLREIGQLDGIADPSGMSSLGGMGGLGGMDRLGGHTSINELGTTNRQVDGQSAVTGLDAMTLTNGSIETGGTDRTNETSVTSSLTRAVQYIVGPTAVPDQELLDYAMRRGREPSSRRDLVRYIPHMQRIARATYGEFLAHRASQNASTSGDSEKASNSSTGTPTGTGKPLPDLLADLDVMVLQRAAEWSREQRLRRQNNIMNEISRTMPQWFHMF